MFEESVDESWRLRYGAVAPEGADVSARFLAHRSVRKYSDRAVPEALVSGLVAAAQSAATSSNLQLWSVVSVQDPARRKEIAQLCADQAQVHAAPWFFAFLVDHYRLRRCAALVGEECKGLDYNEFYTMAVVDASLAAERMVCAAEAVGLGICYIGALRNDPNAVADLLSLPEGTFGLFGLCIGYPSEDARAEIKPRLPQSAVWMRETYDRGASIGDYDERMSAFYESQKMKGEVTWTMRSGRRVDEHHLTGREVLRRFLEQQGFLKR
jgi:nitroreductase